MKSANTKPISHKLEFAELLIRHGAGVNAKAHYWSDDDETPLHLATSQKCKFMKQITLIIDAC